MPKSRQQRYNQRNRWKLAESQAWYRAKQLGHIPPWAPDERQGMRLAFEQAWADSQAGRPYEVDHAIPLRGDPDVCGLHCLANLRIVPREDNRVVWSIREQRPIRRGTCQVGSRS